MQSLFYLRYSIMYLPYLFYYLRYANTLPKNFCNAYSDYLGYSTQAFTLSCCNLDLLYPNYSTTLLGLLYQANTIPMLLYHSIRDTPLDLLYSTWDILLGYSLISIRATYLPSLLDLTMSKLGLKSQARA